MVLAILLPTAALLSLRARAIDHDLRSTPLHLRGARYLGSGACKTCHPGNYASWHRTFHRTMTQEATSQSVLGDFRHGHLDYLGVQATMRRDARGRFVIEWSRRGGLERWRAVVVRTVGSRRYQQYLARDGDAYYRLPIAWNVQEHRFMHMNGAFLTPDPVLDAPGGSVERADYDRHVTRWNDNCIYCHNVAPNPGLDPESGRFRSRVAELGIACEACHGPGSRHAAANHDPLRRFVLHLRALPDPTIANPARLPGPRSDEVCGHCHGQRIAPDIARVHQHGDRFLPGQKLARYSKPLARDTVQNGTRGLFAPRFWRDGTARLTAYEYQGLLQSACARRGGLRCIGCHAMHGGDPRGQIRPDRLGDAACTGCHQDLRSAAASSRHSHHRPSSPGARCIGCHMPRIVYGLVGAHHSHRIDSPHADTREPLERPDACALCHVDKSRAWSADALSRWSGRPAAGGARTSTAEVTALLLAGDPIQRAIAADALGRSEVDATEAAVPARLGLLLDTMQHDGYPAVRAIAWRSLRALLGRKVGPAPAVEAFTATDSSNARARSIAAILARLPPTGVAPPSPELSALRAEQPRTRIFIGE